MIRAFLARLWWEIQYNNRHVQRCRKMEGGIHLPRKAKR